MGASTQHNEYGLTMKELELCRLYTQGERKYRGDQTACFVKVYKEGEEDKHTISTLWTYAHRKFSEPKIKEHIKRLTDAWDEQWIKAKLEQETRTEKSADRIRATELLGKTHAMFTDKVEQDVKIQDILLNDEE